MSKETSKNSIISSYKKNKYGRLLLAEHRKLDELPDLLYWQEKGFNDFINYYLPQLFKETLPIQYIAWDQKLSLNVTDITVSPPNITVDKAKRIEKNYAWLVKWKLTLINETTGEVLFDKMVNIAMLPILTPNCSYIINWVERVIISQIVKSFGIFFDKNSKDLTTSFKIVPKNWVWLETTVEKRWYITVRLDRSRKFPLTTLLRVLGFETDESIRQLFPEPTNDKEIDYIGLTLKKDNTSSADEAALFIYDKIRPGENIDTESAQEYIKNLFLNPNRMELGSIVLRKINSKLGLQKDHNKEEDNLLTDDIIISAVKYLLNLANWKSWYYKDDVDYLSNRRVRLFGEIMYDNLQPIFRRFSKSIRGKLSVLDITDTKSLKITDLVNFKMIDNSIKYFFATSQLSQFLDQVNPIAELEHKRRLTALWPSGIKRETATFEVRDVHPSHYGRICPIETPEGHNIGLVIYQALYSRINEDWFLEVPALKVIKELKPKKEQLVNRIADEDIVDKKGKIIVKDGDYIDEKAAEKIEKEYTTNIKVRPFVSKEREYISPENDEKCIIADITIPLDEYKNILSKRVSGRHYYDMKTYHVNDITHVDVDPSCIFSANTSSISFVDHNDPVRALMGTNMQRQAVPLIRPEAVYSWTWIEWDIAERTHAVKKAEDDGEIIYVDAKRVKVKYKKLWVKEHELSIFKKSNQKSVIHQVSKVSLWDKVKKGDVLFEWPSVVNGELALGKNLRVGFVPYEGYNFEDAIIINQRLVKDDSLSVIHMVDFEIEVSETKLWSEEITADIPSVSLSKLKNLDENGIVKIWTYVKWGDILVWKVTPKSEWDLTPEEKLVHAIFWDKSKSVKDTSLYLPAGISWKVVDIVELSAEKWDDLPANVLKKIKVYVASTRKVEIWDKMAWRHWNKGIVSRIVKEEDMPFTKDWQPLDIILNPLGVISRMNLGQVFETHLWLVAKTLWEKLAVPLFSWFDRKDIQKLMIKLNLPEDWKFDVYDGKTWQKYDNKITVWYMYMLRLVHMVEDKIHARSVWPYSLITQQPLGGKAHNWGQRLWEMEVWALEAYSAVNTLQEMLTIKSDYISWRNKAYEAIIKWNPINVSWLPESFNLLVYELKWLAQNIIFLDNESIDNIHAERMKRIRELNLKWIKYQDWNSLEVATNVDEDDKNIVIDDIVKDMEEYGEIDNSD